MGHVCLWRPGCISGKPWQEIKEAVNATEKLNAVEGKEKCSVEVSNRFAALEDLDAGVEIVTIWETIRDNIKTSAI
jgi:hypothetical protein